MPFAAAAPVPDLATAVLLAQDDLSTRLTVLTLSAQSRSEQVAQVLELLKDLSDLVGECEEALGLSGVPSLAVHDF
ncbi:hypothetical protein [Cyanobium sp. CH-040]|uniref:hypothetical protein n=1 Tax=Cyanobium sp. CH-040 TaxID=2823708 RepID=UPI0020CEBF2B|nr:hypothetical protein [Cyanobium sp. CH-040]MCP9926399.1 hypothetical protein [Cyanobium sp. CH-040]